MVAGKNRSQIREQETLLIVGDADSADVDVPSLRDRGYSVHSAIEEVALNAPRPGNYSVVLVDLASTRKCRLKDLPQLKKVYPRAKFIVLDGRGSIEAAVAAIKAGAWDYLHRPISLDLLCEKIDQAQVPRDALATLNGDPIVAYIGEHATAISSRSAVANRFGLSLDTVSSRVRAVTGKTFTEYLHLCRLDQALRLLASTELNISQVAARVGFSTPQHFSRIFRKHNGLSPARYRLQERAQKNQSSEH